MKTARPWRRVAARQDKARRSSRVKTPLLVKAYLMGEEFSSENNPDEQAATRLVQADYLSWMHRCIHELRMLERRPPYQYPRHHSFQTFLNNLALLGLVEKTGRTEPSVRATAPGFEERH
jgi:hypothetical protein